MKDLNKELSNLESFNTDEEALTYYSEEFEKLAKSKNISTDQAFYEAEYATKLTNFHLKVLELDILIQGLKEAKRMTELEKQKPENKE